MAKSNKKGMIIKIFITYLIIFLATLAFTGVINIRKYFSPKTKVVKKANVVKKDSVVTGSQQTASSAVTASQVIPTPVPITLPAPTSASTPSVSGSQPEKDNIEYLAKVYAKMDSDQTAKIFDNLTDKEVITFLQKMPEAVSGEVLAAMDSVRAAKITTQMMTASKK